VVFAVDRAGIVGADGPTHQGTFDLSYFRCMPNIVVSAPKDEDELRSLLYTAINYKDGPIVIRYPRSKGVGVKFTKYKKLPIGKAEILKEGNKGVVWAVGSMVHPTLEGIRDLDVGVVNARFVKPLDEELLRRFKGKKIITIEENTLIGGFGSGVLEFFNKEGIEVKMLRIGLPDQFIEHGERKLLLEKYKLISSHIRRRIKEFISA
jgi:1-deoxy-D-xylulose-5-phosphate synthase